MRRLRTKADPGAIQGAHPQTLEYLTGPAVSPKKMASHARAGAEFVKVLAHADRLMVLCVLRQGERSVSALERILGLRQSTTSQHLARLRRDGLIARRRDGKTVYYGVADPNVRVILDAVYQAFFAQPRKRGP